MGNFISEKKEKKRNNLMGNYFDQRKTVSCSDDRFECEIDKKKSEIL